MAKYQSLSIALRPAEHEAFKNFAARMGEPISALVRRALAASYGPAMSALGSVPPSGFARPGPELTPPFAPFDKAHPSRLSSFSFSPSGEKLSEQALALLPEGTPPNV